MWRRYLLKMQLGLMNIPTSIMMSLAVYLALVVNEVVSKVIKK